MKKRKLHHHLTRTVHPNRELLWTVSLALIAGIALLGYIIVTGFGFDYNSSFSSSKVHPVYADKIQKYSVQYPNGWQLEKDLNGNTIFDNPQNSNESVTITETGAQNEAAIRKSISIGSERQYSRNGFQIDRIESKKQMQGVNFEAALLVQSGKLFYISGYTGSLDTFVNTLQILQ